MSTRHQAKAGKSIFQKQRDSRRFVCLAEPKPQPKPKPNSKPNRKPNKPNLKPRQERKKIMKIPVLDLKSSVRKRARRRCESLFVSVVVW